MAEELSDFAKLVSSLYQKAMDDVDERHKKLEGLNFGERLIESAPQLKMMDTIARKTPQALTVAAAREGIKGMGAGMARRRAKNPSKGDKGSGEFYDDADLSLLDPSLADPVSGDSALLKKARELTANLEGSGELYDDADPGEVDPSLAKPAKKSVDAGEYFHALLKKAGELTANREGPQGEFYDDADPGKVDPSLAKPAKKSVDAGEYGFPALLKKARELTANREGPQGEFYDDADEGPVDPTLAQPTPETAAQAAAAATEEQLLEDFKITHGGPFDPNSTMDRGKMEVLKRARMANPDDTGVQLALKIYRGNYDAE